jgi:hypothetical protein
MDVRESHKYLYHWILKRLFELSETPVPDDILDVPGNEFADTRKCLSL